MTNWLTNKIEAIQAKRRRRLYAENEFFSIYTGEGVFPQKDIIAVEILRGEFKGTVFAYSTVNIDHYGKCEFTFRVIKEPYISFNPTNNKFQKITGQVLIVILENSITPEEENEYDELGEDYSEEPVQKRTIHQKDPTLHQERIL